MKKIRILPLLMALLISVSVFAACSSSSSDGINESSNAGNVGGAETEAPAERYINGVSLEDYTIVYSPDDHDYSWRAAEYIQKQIELVTTLKLDVRYEVEGSFEHEIVVGETSRDISKALDADTEGFQFAILADDAHIACRRCLFLC